MDLEKPNEKTWNDFDFDPHALVQPDVVISGINEGQNVSAQIATSVSGTVGAAKTAALAGISALAASQGASQGLGNPATTYDFPAGVDAVMTWLAANRSALIAGGAAPTNVTNLNIPSCDAGTIRGTLPGLTLAPTTTGAFAGQDCLSTLVNPANDVEGLNNGFTTLSPVPLN